MGKPLRIISLCPSITETLIDFGLATSLVGVTKFCIHPSKFVSKINKVGGTKDPDIDAIVKLNPDLIFMNAEENRKEDHKQLSHHFQVEVSEPRRVGDVPALLRKFGEQTDRREKAEQRAQELETELDKLKQEATASHFSYAYFIWRKPWMVAGRDTYVQDLLSLAGGQNIFEEKKERYPTVKLEELARLKPEFIFLADEPFPFRESHVGEIANIAPKSKVQVINGDDCCWHGIRSIRGVQLMRKHNKTGNPGFPR